jgi:hypothetical protein
MRERMVLSPADSKAVGDIRWREPLCWLCVGAQRSGYPASRGVLRLSGSSTSRMRPILRELVGAARVFGGWWRQVFDPTSARADWVEVANVEKSEI